MRKLVLLLLIFLMASCLNHQDPKTEKTARGGNSLAPQILGMWAGKDDLNAMFEINNHDFYYPDQSSIYKYTIFKDSLVIDYKDYRDTFKIETKGNDTLILSNKSDGRQVFHRFKKSFK